MLALFPQLLFLAPVAIALLRIVLGVSILAMGWSAFTRAEAMHHAVLPIIGHAPEWLIRTGALILSAVGIALVLGAWTQVGALLAAIAAFKHWIGSRWYPDLLPLASGTYGLLFIIAVALIFMGAGTFALDLPL